MRIADQGELEGVGAPTSPQLPLCLAAEAGAAHPVGGNLGIRGMSTKMCCTKLHQWSCTGPTSETPSVPSERTDRTISGITQSGQTGSTEVWAVPTI